MVTLDMDISEDFTLEPEESNAAVEIDEPETAIQGREEDAIDKIAIAVAEIKGNCTSSSTVDFLHYRAVNKGDEKAQFWLAYLYYKGSSWQEKVHISVSHEKAFKLFKESANGGCTRALNSLGIMYENGHHVSRDVNIAAKYYRQAISEGAFNSYDNLAALYFFQKHGFASDMSEQERVHQAVQLWEQGSLVGDPACNNSMGWLYYNGMHVQKNLELAFEYWRDAADEGNAAAHYNLARMYIWEEGVTRDSKKISEHLEKAIELGDAEAEVYKDCWQRIESAIQDSRSAEPTRGPEIYKKHNVKGDKRKRIRISVPIDEQLKARFIACVDANEHSMQAVIEQAVGEYLERFETAAPDPRELLKQQYQKEFTEKGTPRKRRPYRKRSEIGGDPSKEQFASSVKLGARVQHELRDEFVQFAKEKGLSQGSALELALKNLIEYS